MVFDQIAAAAPGIIGGIVGGNKKADSAKDAEKYLDSIADEWRNLNLPDLSPVEFEHGDRDWETI